MTMNKSNTVILLMVVIFSLNCLANECEEFGKLIDQQGMVNDVTVVSATLINKGETVTFPADARMLPSGPFNVGFCRVEGIIEEEIKFELWLPEKSQWNGRYLGVGNGGEAGWINYNELHRGLHRHFATASTDTGHQQADVHWGLGHPQRIENFGHRAHHLLAINAKQLIKAYYGQSESYSYFIGCSGGGLQGMNEVQRYPADYDGIISGAAGYSMVPLSARFVLSGLLEIQEAEHNLSRDQWQRVAKDAVESCDAKDGISDGIVNDPRACNFDIKAIDYLTAKQQQRVATLYGPLLDEKGEQLYPGFYPGIQFIPQARQLNVAGRSFGEWLYQDPNWQPEDFQLAKDLILAEASLSGLRAANPDLTPFARMGGKLITYVGWEDPTVPAQANIDYYRSVQKIVGDDIDNFFRLFMVPGMGHCRGGVGPDQFGQAFAGDAPVIDANHDLLAAIIAWVEEGKAPNKVIASRIREGKIDMTRPICPFPSQAHYLGTGDPNQAENFVCQ